MTFFDQPGRDGRRKSSPLLDISNSPARAPGYQLNRHLIADDAAASGGLLAATVLGGCNFGDYEFGSIQIIQRDDVEVNADPGGTSEALVSVFEWSPALSRFVDTGLAFDALASGESAAFELEAKGRLLFFHVTGIVGGDSVSIFSQGFADEE